MTLTTLDPRTALIVIDLQNAVVALPLVHPADEVVQQASVLAAAFRRHDLPVVVVTAIGRAPGRIETPPPVSVKAQAPGWTDPVAELGAQPSDLRVTKKTWGAFVQTGLDDLLKASGVTQVVVVGIVTTRGVESTARQAYEHGFNVTLAVDAMTDVSMEAHDNTVARIFPNLGETGTTAEVIALLDATR